MEIEIVDNVFRSIYQETGYNKFVLLGSLSVIGTKTNKIPPNMMISNDIDCYIPDNPEAIFELTQFQENSDFHKEVGYYIDSCGRNTAALPNRWESRAIRRLIKTNKDNILVIIPSLDDITVSKTYRFADNDKRWIVEGIKAVLIYVDNVANRISVCEYETHEDTMKAKSNFLKLLNENRLPMPCDIFDWKNGEHDFSDDFNYSIDVIYNVDSRQYEISVSDFQQDKTIGCRKFAFFDKMEKARELLKESPTSILKVSKQCLKK